MKYAQLAVLRLRVPMIIVSSLKTQEQEASWFWGVTHPSRAPQSTVDTCLLDTADDC